MFVAFFLRIPINFVSSQSDKFEYLDLDIIMSQDHCCDMDATWSGGALYTVFLQTSLKAV